MGSDREDQDFEDRGFELPLFIPIVSETPIRIDDFFSEHSIEVDVSEFSEDVHQPEATPAEPRKRSNSITAPIPQQILTECLMASKPTKKDVRQHSDTVNRSLRAVEEAAIADLATRK